MDQTGPGVNAVEVRLLGPVALRAGGRYVGLGSPQQRCVFAILAMTPRQAVPVDLVVDRVWGGQPPRNARTVVYTYVSRLRGALGQSSGQDAGRQHGGGQDAGGRLLRRRDGGYALEIDPDRVDLHRARRLASQARAATGQPGGHQRSAGLLAEACALWTESPLAGINGEWADRVRVGLAHERLSLLAERFGAALRIGQHDEVIGPLSQALAANPLAESLAGLLMLALHRTGRHADALEVYGQLRRRLVDQVGDEPGPALRRVHERLLRRDREVDLDLDLDLALDLRMPAVQALATPVAPAPGAAGRDRAGGPAVRPWVPVCQLPPGVWHFVGRQSQLGQLVAALTPGRAGHGVPVALVTGPPGVGKTALATQVAQLVRDRYPDGQWHVRLGGVTGPRDPARIAAELLASSGLDPGAIPAGLERRTALLRAGLADRRVLMLLDDAADAAQVRALLPGTAGAAVLVTSQRRLSGLAPASSVHLGPLPDPDAADLLGRLVGGDRVAGEPEATAAVVAACGGLPLALRIAAARLTVHPGWNLERLATRLRDRRRRLDELAVDDLAVRPCLELSYRALAPAVQGAFRWLGLLDGAEVAAGTVGLLTDADGDQLVEGLVTASLLEGAGIDATGEPRYRLPELVATYAAELADQHPPAGPDQLVATVERVRLAGRHREAARLARLVGPFPPGRLLPPYATAPRTR